METENRGTVIPRFLTQAQFGLEASKTIASISNFSGPLLRNF